MGDMAKQEFLKDQKVSKKTKATRTYLNLEITESALDRHFSITTTTKKDEDFLMMLQKQLGYHPAGYGFYMMHEERLKSTKYKYTWSCMLSCD